MSKPKVPKMPEAPPSSVINSTPSYMDEIERLGDADLEKVHIIEVDRRLALMARFVLEAALKSRGEMSLKDKSDVAIKTINVVEGAKQRVELWARDMERDVPRTVEQLEAERQATEARLRMLLERRDGIKPNRQQEEAEAAIDVIAAGLPVDIPEA